MEKAIIFGANGQDGYYLSALLSLRNIEVVTISRRSGTITGDISDLNFVENIIQSLQPNYVFHFAANSSADHCALNENHKSISTGTLNILESVRKHSIFTKVFLSGSALQFKNDGKPIDENTPFEASSAYAAERIYSVYLARYFRDKFNVKVYVGYLFNHDSYLRSDNHINQKIVKTAVRIFKGSNEKLIIGDPQVKKEFNYAGDIVSAIWNLINQNCEYEVVIGSGLCYSIESWIEYCFNKFGLSWEKHTVINQDFLSEYKILVSNPQKIRALGWKPLISITEMADDMILHALENY